MHGHAKTNKPLSLIVFILEKILLKLNKLQVN